MHKTALVIGATGLIGRALTNQLASADHIQKVVTFTRKPMPHPSEKVENCLVNFTDLDQYTELFRGDLLFSCLGTTRKQAGSLAAQRKVDVDFQLAAARLAANNKVPHYLLVSSSGANVHSGSAYMKLKGELEQAVQELPFERISIFRPSLLLGQREQVRTGEMLGSWVLPVLCKLPGLRRYRPIRGEQVAKKMLEVSRNTGPQLETFTLDELFLL